MTRRSSDLSFGLGYQRVLFVKLKFSASFLGLGGDVKAELAWLLLAFCYCSSAALVNSSS